MDNNLLMRARRYRGTQVTLPRELHREYFNNVDCVTSVHDGRSHKIITAIARRNGKLNMIKAEIPETKDFQEPILLFAKNADGIFYEAIDGNTPQGSESFDLLKSGIPTNETRLSSQPSNYATWWRFINRSIEIPANKPPLVAPLSEEQRAKLQSYIRPKREKVVDPILDAIRQARKEVRANLPKAQQCNIVAGSLYVNHNEAFDHYYKGEYYKVGKALDHENRTDDYQTYDPFRNFVTVHTSRVFENRALAEEKLKDILRPKLVRPDVPNSEWYAITLAELLQIFSWLENYSGLKTVQELIW